MTHALRVLGVAAALAVAGPAGATGIQLFELGINRDGEQPTPAGVTYDIDPSGLGAVRVSVSGDGLHQVLAYYDFDIGNASDDDYGGTSGAPGPGQSWEIDGPALQASDIYANFVAGTLDGTNTVPADDPDDAAMALGWNFSLASVAAEVIFHTSLAPPDAPFFLWQTDADSNRTVYLWATLDTFTVPEPGTLALLGLGLVGLLAQRRRLT